MDPFSFSLDDFERLMKSCFRLADALVELMCDAVTDVRRWCVTQCVFSSKNVLFFKTSLMLSSSFLIRLQHRMVSDEDCAFVLSMLS